MQIPHDQVNLPTMDCQKDCGLVTSQLTRSVILAIVSSVFGLVCSTFSLHGWVQLISNQDQ